MKTGVYFGRDECEIQGPVVVYGAQSINANEVIKLAEIIIRSRRGNDWGMVYRYAERFDAVVDAICERTGAHRVEVCGTTRKQVAAFSRHMVAAAMRELYPSITLTSIGRLLGGRDHSTVIHSIDAHEALMTTDVDYRHAYNDATSWLKSEA